jgi:hypothetical protein
MAEDEPTAGPAGTAEAVGAKQEDAMHQPGSKPSPAGQRSWVSGHWATIRSWLSSHYRLLVFLVILLVAVITGFHYKSLADPGTEPTHFRTQPPQYLHIYVNGYVVKSTIAVHLLTHQLNTRGYTNLGEFVDVLVTYPRPVSQRTIILTSSNVPVGPPSRISSQPGQLANDL